MYKLPPAYEYPSVKLPSVLLAPHSFIRPLITQDLELFGKVIQAPGFAHRLQGAAPGTTALESPLPQFSARAPLVESFLDIQNRYKSGSPSFFVAVVDRVSFEAKGMAAVYLDPDGCDQEDDARAVALELLVDYCDESWADQYSWEAADLIIKYCLQHGASWVRITLDDDPELQKKAVSAIRGENYVIGQSGTAYPGKIWIRLSQD